MANLPTSTKELASEALNIIEICRTSQNKRMAAYKVYGQICETGRQNGELSMANLIYSHIDRLAAHLFSPSELRFAIDYESIYPKEWLEKGAVAARVVSREWERHNIDMKFGHGVKEALTYGSCILKQLGGRTADGNFYFKGARLIMPWAFGVYDESINDLSDQEAFVETVWMNQHEVWRRVRNLPEAEKLYKQILGNAKKDDGTSLPNSFMHNVLSTAVLSTNQASPPQPGGLVQLNATDPTFSPLGPIVAADLYPMHELWVRDDRREGGYTTIQLFEPGIVVAPAKGLRHSNLFIEYPRSDDGRITDPSDVHPYTLIQPNFEPGYFWGRSEIADLQELQGWLTQHLDDIKQIVDLQIQKIVSIEGYDGLTDELYSQITRVPGVYSVGQGVKVTDMSPKLDPLLLQITTDIIALMERVSGFPPIMSGQGEPGVRAGVHADTLMKTGSPRLRDRSLLVERQCVGAADITLSFLQAKEAKAFWTNPANEATDFTLEQLPDDRRIVVDSHSGSPIFHDDNMQLLAFGLKTGIVTGESFIEQSPLAHKDILIERLKAKQAAEQKMLIEHPELAPGGKRRQAVVAQASEAPITQATH